VNATISRRDAGVVLAAVALAASTAGKAAVDVDVASAAVDLYARMTARDLAGVLRYIPAAGFTEIGPSAPSVHVLKPAAFEALFNSDAVIKLRAEDVNVQRFGSTAVVTGVRVGSVGPKDKPSTELRAPFTMVWTSDNGGWQLRHIHLSS
jgi:ketosteroid isomerase-like protein